MDRVKHFTFPENYFFADRPIHLNRERHPTWKIRFDNRFSFGGVLDETTSDIFVHLLTLDDSLSDIGISGLSTITLGVHLNELNEFPELFYHHDHNGRPNRIGIINTPSISDSFPIKSAWVGLAETPERWHAQDWATSNSRENLFKLGGEPS